MAPIRLNQSDGIRRRSAQRDRGYVEPAPERGQYIWVADDNGDVRLLLCRAFKRFFPPVPVEFFSDGAAIVERVRRGTVPPKLLLLDFEMPSLNGIETIETLTSQGQTEGMTILVFSTNAESAVVRHAYAAGAHFFLQKPVGGDEYRDLAKLCLKCLDLRTPIKAPAIGSAPLHVSTVLASIESECLAGLRRL